jgi:hypothetical protein
VGGAEECPLGDGKRPVGVNGTEKSGHRQHHLVGNWRVGRRDGAGGGASAGGCLDEAHTLWARARREHVEGISPGELAAECRKVLETVTASAARLEDTIAAARSDESRRMRGLVSVRYRYTSALVEVARNFRQQKMKAKQVRKQLARTPFPCADRATVTFEDGKFIVKFDNKVLGCITDQQFIKQYWPQGKILTTP